MLDRPYIAVSLARAFRFAMWVSVFVVKDPLNPPVGGGAVCWRELLTVFRFIIHLWFIKLKQSHFRLIVPLRQGDERSGGGGKVVSERFSV